MSYTRISLLCVILTTFLLVGCNRQSMGQTQSTAAVIAPMPSSTEVSQELSLAEDVQNQRERQLVMLFLGLLVMDRQPSLSLTAEQSREILPLVLKSEEEGSIDETEQNSVISVLTKEQKAYLEEQAKQMKLRKAERMSNHRGELSTAERERFVNAFEGKRRKIEQKPEEGNVQQATSENQSSDPRSMGKSVEQQLIDLLISKL